MSSRLGALALAALLFGVCLLLFRGTLETSDEIQMALTTAGLVETGTPHFVREYQGLRFSGYGLGTPLLGIPAYLLQKALDAQLPPAVQGLAALSNGFLLAAIGVLLALLLRGERRWGAVAIVLLASPILPLSLTFYSEPLAGAGLLALIVGLRRPGAWWLAGLGALAAVLARSAMVPFCVLAAVWGWREGADRRALIATASGIAAAVAVTLWQNWILRGSPFTTGYVGQDFTTPLATGLYGLLVSPERGILLFFPALVVPFVAWQQLPMEHRSLLRVGAALGLCSLVLHALFWTWHGGWTAGPRFLLPALLVLCAPLAWLWMHRPLLPAWIRHLLVLTTLWSALLAWIYTHHSPSAWWNMLWGFHQEENQWLFFPQLSLWQAWLEGVPLPSARPPWPDGFRIALLTIALLLVLPALYPLLLAWRGRLGTDPAPPSDVPMPRRIIGWLLTPHPIAFLLVLFWIASALALLSGPRGWKGTTGDVTHLAVEGDVGDFEGWIDQPLDSPIRLYAKANAVYRVFVDEQVVMEQMEPIPQHLPRVELPLKKGLHSIRVEVRSKDGTTPPRFHLYWTWGGGGRYLTPVGGEYLSPRPLNPFERAITWAHRRVWLLGAGILALLLLLRLPQRGSGPQNQG